MSIREFRWEAMSTRCIVRPTPGRDASGHLIADTSVRPDVTVSPCFLYRNHLQLRLSLRVGLVGRAGVIWRGAVYRTV